MSIRNDARKAPRRAGAQDVGERMGGDRRYKWRGACPALAAGSMRRSGVEFPRTGISGLNPGRQDSLDPPDDLGGRIDALAFARQWTTSYVSDERFAAEEGVFRQAASWPGAMVFQLRAWGWRRRTASIRFPTLYDRLRFHRSGVSSADTIYTIRENLSKEGSRTDDGEESG